MPAKKAVARRYQPHPMLALEEKAMKALAEETGRTYDQWVALARRKGPRERRALKSWLQEQGLTNMRAHWVTASVLDPDGLTHDEPEPLVDALYSGTKAALRPLHEKLVDAALALGDDVLATACKTMVPLYRKHCFADLRPVDGAVEMRLALGDAQASGRLERAPSRDGGDRLTHRVRVRSAREIDAELKRWLREAYEAGAGKRSRPVGDVAVPADLARPLKASATARTTWEQCTPAMRRDLVGWIEAAKRAETREKRVGMVFDALASGRRRVY